MSDPSAVSASESPLTLYDLEEKQNRRNQKMMTAIAGIVYVNKHLLVRYM